MMLYAILAVVALLGLGGMSSCAYKKGHDSRDQEVQNLRIGKESAEANVAQRDQIISTQNDALEKISTVGKDAKALAQTAIAQSKAREAAEKNRRDSLDAIARSGGTESAVACPKTAATLGDLSDVMRGGEPAPAPVVPQVKQPVLPPKPTPLPPKPVLPQKVKP